MQSSERRSTPSRLPLAVSVVLIAGCALAAYGVTASDPTPSAIPARTAAPAAPAAVRPAPPAYVPLSPLAQTDVQALGGARAKPSWRSLLVRLPASLPPAVRIPSVPITVPLRPGYFAGYESGLDPFGDEFGDAFGDPADGAIPLLWIAGEEDAMLTPGFRVADFASRDGGQVVRISYQLVEGLERLRQEAGSLGIISGYRNAAHNAAVGGVAHSQHLEGKAADVWSADRDPLDLARLALQTIGCEVGLGLGPRSLHLDVRGELVTWTYPGAAMPNAAFDAWALAQCGLPVPPELAQEAAEAWLTDGAGASLDTLYDDAAPTELLARYHNAVVEAARTGYLLEGPGAVVLDFRAGVPPSRYLPPSYLRYVSTTAPEAATLGIDELVAWRERGRQHTYFVYAVLTPGAAPAVGVSSFAAMQTAPAPEPEPPTALGAAEPRPADQPAAEAAPSTGGEAWTIVVASHVDETRADRSAERFRSALDAYPIAITYDDEASRYRVTAGRFRTPGAAQSALEDLGNAVPQDAWVYRL